jgi:hypothetical protein
VTKRGVFFVVFGLEMYLQNGQVFFVPKWPKGGGGLLVIYVGNILDSKNTLCNTCFLNRFICFIQILQSYMGNVHFKPCD